MAEIAIGKTNSYFQFYEEGTYGKDNLYAGIQILYGLDWTSVEQNYSGYDIETASVNATFNDVGEKGVPVWMWAALDPRIVDPSLTLYSMNVGDTIEIALTENIDSADIYHAHNPNNNIGNAYVFLGPGDDTIGGGTTADLLVGGDGNDQIFGANGNDTIYGDYSNLPVYQVVKISPGYNATPQSSPAGAVFQPVLPAQGSVARTPINPDDSEPTGDDVINGEGGQDVIYGGPGADNLSGGPRGQSGSDVVFGGADADIFNISTNIPATISSDPGASNGFWGTYGGEIVGGAGSSATSSIIKTITKSVLPTVMEDAVGGFVFSSIAGAASSLVGASLKNLFSNSTPTPTPTVSGNDILIVADFDPREDTLYLPVNEILEIDARVITTVSSGNELLPPDETYGVTSLEFFFPGEATENKVTDQNAQVGDVTFARVIFSADYLTALGIDENTTPSAQVQLFENVLSQEFVVGDDSSASGNTSGTGLQFKTDTSSYVNGVVPDSVGDPNSFGLQAPSGSKAVVFGAFAPWSIVNPAVSSSVPGVAGTNLSDILNVNGNPLNVISPIHTKGLATLTFEVYGFGGDDIIIGGTGTDDIYGGDGDDIIYDLGQQGDSKAQETLEGGSGNDLVYAGINTTSAFYNGGDGLDTIDFVYLTDDNLVVDLSTTVGTAKSYDGSTETLYQLSNVENVTGSPQSDRITGSAGANVFGYSRSDDVIDGGGGSDTYSFSNWVPFTSTTTVGATITIANGPTPGEIFLTATLLDAVATEQQNSKGDLEWVYVNTPVTFTDTLTGIGTLVGTVANDTVNGSLSNSALVLEGVGGDDILSGSVLDDWLLGGAGNDSLTGGSGVDTINGGDGYDIFAFASNGTTGAGIDLAYEDSTGAAVGAWTDAFGFHDIVDRSTIEAYWGTPGDDYFVGDGGNGTNALYSADFYGMGGADYLAGSGLGQLLDGGDGNDTLNGLGGDDTIIGGADPDSVTGGDGADVFQGTPEELEGDVIQDFSIDDILRVMNPGTFPADYAFGVQVIDASPSRTILGITEADEATVLAKLTLVGDFVGEFKATVNANSVDIVYTAASVLFGTPNDDLLVGGDAADIAYGRDGNDTLLGKGGNDRLHGEKGRDLIRGHKGDDGLFGGRGEDSLYGGPGNDELNGGRGNDLLRGGVGSDTLDGGRGDDHLFGEAGPDFLFGRNGDDQLCGGSGNDELNGGRGNDLLRGGVGDDLLTGDKGDDAFVFALGKGTDTLLDYGVGDDMIGLDGLSFGDLTIGQAGDDATISANGEVLAVLVGVESMTLNESDFFVA